MKYLFIFSVFAFIVALAYWRLRPYLKMAKQMLGMVQDVRRMHVGSFAETPSTQKTQPAAEKLVRCASCDTWLPVSRAVTLRTSTNSYCSHACLERAAAPHASRRSAS